VGTPSGRGAGSPDPPGSGQALPPQRPARPAPQRPGSSRPTGGASTGQWSVILIDRHLRDGYDHAADEAS
jgi:hypothetical protein